jgi:SAM-dependent methyltransferase
VIATRKLPQHYREWNERVGAPFGRNVRLPRPILRRISSRLRARLTGPFAFQPNNTTRVFEYPWAYFAADIRPGQSILEIGGSLSGFQFALAQQGASVVNVDPGLAAEGRGWLCDMHNMSRLNRYFGTDVQLRNTTVDHANLEADHYDRAFAISVLEHLPRHEAIAAVEAVYRSLKPGGLFVLTIDLFLNLEPFTTRVENEFGRNVDVGALVGGAPFTVYAGEPSELNGFPAFDPDRVQSHLEDYLLGTYPALAQCLVLRRPDRKG